MASMRSCAEAAAHLAASPIKTRRKLPSPIAPCVQPIDPPYQWGYVKKVPKAGCTQTFYSLPGSRARWMHTNILFPARQQDQVGISGARRLGCGAVKFHVVRGRHKPGERNHAAGADPHARAGETKRRKLLPQLLIALE